MPVAASTRGYKAEIRVLQPEQRPLRNTQLNKGISSYHPSRLRQFVQWDGAVTMLSPLGPG
jgi:hypothetical protein